MENFPFPPPPPPLLWQPPPVPPVSFSPPPYSFVLETSQWVPLSVALSVTISFSVYFVCKGYGGKNGAEIEVKTKGPEITSIEVPVEVPIEVPEIPSIEVPVEVSIEVPEIPSIEVPVEVKKEGPAIPCFICSGCGFCASTAIHYTEAVICPGCGFCSHYPLQPVSIF